MRTYNLYCCLLFKRNITDYMLAYNNYVFITSFCARLSNGCTPRRTETTKWLGVFSACFPQLGIKHTFVHSRIIICFGQFLWKCYYLERMLEDYDGPHLLTDSPVHNLKPGERVVCSEHTAYGKLLDALTSPFTFLSVTSNIQVFILRSILICIKSKVTRNLAIKENNQLLLEYLDNSRPHSLNYLLSNLLIVMLHWFSAKASKWCVIALSINQYLHQYLAWSKLNRIRFVIMISFYFQSFYRVMEARQTLDGKRGVITVIFGALKTVLP